MTQKSGCGMYEGVRSGVSNNNNNKYLRLPAFLAAWLRLGCKRSFDVQIFLVSLRDGPANKADADVMLLLLVSDGSDFHCDYVHRKFLPCRAFLT